ncbi:MAG: YdcF family protein [Luteolibacter sp.]|uniref:YdcF family protein n=1 Tax=Luteolibacter sp. TaxID=1962973 RepID=UPI0032665387
MKPPARIASLLLPAVICAALLLWSIPSLLIAKKVIGLLVLPSGLVWLGLMALVGWSGLNRWGRLFAAMVLIVYTVAGNSWTGGWLLRKLESPYAAMTHPTEPFDAICVLGGGSSATPDGDAQLGPAGDRLIVPARLFISGKTKHLVASGLSVTDISGSRSLADDTATVWRELGIPETAITRLSKPRTTGEEIRAYKELIAANSWKRVGVCSSAWHLRRVEKLCRSEGVEMIPVPADFLSAPLPWTPMYAVPQARGFQNVQKALWEFLGSATGG